MIKKEYLEKYARLLVRNGVNIQKGQPLLINSYYNAAEFTYMCAKEAYAAGASRVVVNYRDDKLSRLNVENMSLDELSRVDDYQIVHRKWAVEHNGAMLHIISEIPGIMGGVDPEKIQTQTLAMMDALKPYRAYSMANVGQWSIGGYPNVEWAEKVFPDLKGEEAEEALFNAILKVSRIDDNDPVDNWNLHNSTIRAHAKTLNDNNFKEIHFTSELGTDLHVGLVKDHIWEGGCEKTVSGIVFNPNIPTEEVFTMPSKYNVNGIVYASKPLVYQGTIIDKFSITFKDGKAVSCTAEKGIEALENLLNTDEGSRYLGEVALVPYDSPISKSGILFFDTLYDENASCHLALGDSYPTNIKNGTNLSDEERDKLGSNTSMNHVDFMFGTKDLKAVGVKYDGSEVVVMDEGNFVI